MVFSWVLVGIKHCGKSTLGKLLAERWRMPFIDADSVLEAEYEKRTGEKLSTREIFKTLGEEAFRKLEAEIIRSLISDEDKVIALGGGAVSNRYITRGELFRLGRIVYLNVSDAVAYPRVAREGLPPFLADAEDPIKRFAEINEERRKAFAEVADITFELKEEKPLFETAWELGDFLEKQ